MLMAFMGLIHNVLMWLNWELLQSIDVGIWSLQCSIYNESEQDKELGRHALNMIFGGISIICIINMIFNIIILILSSLLLFRKSQKE